MTLTKPELDKIFASRFNAECKVLELLRDARMDDVSYLLDILTNLEEIRDVLDTNILKEPT